MSAAEMKNNFDPCPACGRNDWVFIREGGDLRRPDLKKSFILTRCSSCGHVIQNPKPDEQELNAAYTASVGYAAYRAAWKESGWPLWKILRIRTIQRRMLWLERYEIGCEMLSRYGWLA